MFDKFIGYYKGWGPSPPENINWNVYTHVNYAFLGINNDGSLTFDGNETVLRRLSNLKRQHPGLKLLFSVGGWNETYKKNFSVVAADANKKINMANSAIHYLKKYSFDGIDVDWEYPEPADKQNFVDLLRVVRNKFQNTYLLTIAVSPLADPSCYDGPAISKYVDFINVMTYDFHQPSEGKTGQNSPLYASSVDSQWQKENCNCDAAIKKWLALKVPASKLVLGLAFYGQCFKLLNKDKHGVGAPTEKSGRQIPYREIRELNAGWTVVWDDEQKVAYKYSQKEWIGYDEARAIAEKMVYAKKMSLGGVMAWAVNDDNGDLSNSISYNKHPYF